MDEPKNNPGSEVPKDSQGQPQYWPGDKLKRAGTYDKTKKKGPNGEDLTDETIIPEVH